MDIPRLLAMNSYWAKHPPVHLLVAAYMGFKPEPKNLPSKAASEQNNTERDLQDFMQMFGSAGGSVG